MLERILRKIIELKKAFGIVNGLSNKFKAMKHFKNSERTRQKVKPFKTWTKNNQKVWSIGSSAFFLRLLMKLEEIRYHRKSRPRFCCIISDAYIVKITLYSVEGYGTDAQTIFSSQLFWDLKKAVVSYKSAILQRFGYLKLSMWGQNDGNRLCIGVPSTLPRRDSFYRNFNFMYVSNYFIKLRSLKERHHILPLV